MVPLMLNNMTAKNVIRNLMHTTEKENSHTVPKSQ